MTTLANALAHAADRDLAQTAIETTLRDSLQDYLDFLPERGSSWVTHYKYAAYFTFTELDGKNFIFESDEYYCYGENDQDYVSLPFEFVEAPETYKATRLAEIKAAEDAKNARVKLQQQERVAALKAQLASAEASLAKAQEKDDLIGTVALTKQTGEIRSTLNRQAD